MINRSRAHVLFQAKGVQEATVTLSQTIAEDLPPQ